MLHPYISELLKLDESRETGPYASLSMMATSDTMTAGIPAGNTWIKQGIDSLPTVVKFAN